MFKILTVIVSSLILSGCVTSGIKKVHIKPEGTQAAFSKDYYECSWLIINNPPPATKINMQNAGYAGAGISGFIEGYERRAAPKRIWESCLVERGYSKTEISKKEYDKMMSSFADYAKARNIKEGRAKQK